MIYRGYTIVREVQGWQQSAVNDDGSIGEVIVFIEDPDATEWFCVDSKNDANGESLTSVKAAKRWIDWKLDGAEGSRFNLGPSLSDARDTR